jgi:hypothetical protein
VSNNPFGGSSRPSTLVVVQDMPGLCCLFGVFTAADSIASLPALLLLLLLLVLYWW